jgi:methionine-rich copper-binding protein CopC
MAVALGVVCGSAGAHAVIVAARPAMNSMVGPGELEVRLEFNTRIDGQRSRLSLQRPDGAEATVVLVPTAPPNVLAGRVQATMTGRWKLNWQVLSVDGHITRGEVSFSVRDSVVTP